MDGIKERLEQIIGLNFSTFDNEVVPPVSGDEDGIIDVAVSIMSESTQNGYKRICHGIKTICPTPLPSFYMLAKNRPQVVPVSIPLSSILLTDTKINFQHIDISAIEESNNEATLIEKIDIDLDEEIALLQTAQVKDGDNIEGGKLKGDYGEYLESKMFKFLSIARIDIAKDQGWYMSQLNDYIANAKALYASGSSTFLSDGNIVGRLETFYMHTLRFYIPKIAKITYDRHRLGVGTFSMQGFERRNKESKNCLKRFSNNKGNIVVPNMKRLWDVYHHESNAC